MSATETKSPRLRFESKQEMLDYVKKNGERFKDGLTLKGVGDLVKRYERSEVVLVIKLRAGSGDVALEYEFILEAVPRRVDDGGHESWQMAEQPDSEQLVFVRNGYLVEFPKGVIASSVRLARAKKRVKTFGDFLGPCFQVALERDGVATEGKGGVFRPSLASCDSDAVHRIVEGRSKVLNSVCSEVSETGREGLSELELVYLLIRVLRIRLHNYAAFIGLPENLGLPLKISDAFLCKCNLSA